MRSKLLAIAFALFTGPLLAAPVSYDLQPASSTVAFEADFGGQKITGTIPIEGADLVLDFDRLSNCTIAVQLDAANAGASFPFAAEALKGKTVLDTARHPRMSFTSISVSANGATPADGATVKGNLTLRGVTRPVTLQASIFRQQGSADGDLTRLTVRLSGQINRSDFGATGFADMVSDRVLITITARIQQGG